MKKVVYLFITLFFYSACTKKIIIDKKIVLNFPEEKWLIGEELYYDEIGVLEMNVIDTFMILRIPHKENMFNVYELSNQSFIGSFGLKGKGPNEFLGPRYSNQFLIDSTGIKIWINDIIREKYSLINVTKSLESKKTFVEKTFDINAEQLFYFHDDKILGNDDSKKGRMFKYNPKIKEKNYSSFFPVIPQNFHYQFITHKNICKLKTDKSKIVSVMHYFKRIDFFTTNGEIENSVIYQDDYSPSEIIERFEQNKLINYYEDVTVTNDLIFAVYTNQLDDDVADVEKELEIHVFDWSGNPKYLLHVPEYVLNITIDEVNGYLYGLNYLSEDKNYMRYNIQEVIK